MLDLRQARKFFESFTIRSRQTNRPIPFRMNPSQGKVHNDCIAHMDKKRRLFIIFLKARRLGISTWMRMLTQAHLLEKEFSEGLILAQQKVTARALYEESHALAKQLPLPKENWKYTQPEINFWKIPSKLSWQTAGNVVGTRGLGFTLLHATEAAFYRNPDIFPAVFSTLSDDPENMAGIETTPNGKEGPGQAYYELWQATERGDTEYLAEFLPWHDDPDYVRNPDKCKDAPRDDYEKFLMKDLKLGKDRVAFYRITLASKCGGSLDKWRREYPATAEEAFTASGDPVFSFDDQAACDRWSNKTTVKQIELDVAPGHRARARENAQGRFHIFEYPQPGAHYFAGVVIGQAGDEDDDDGAPAQDTVAMIVWNGETGVLAGRICIPLRHASATQCVYGMGCYFNKAMIACEDGSGGFGSRIFQELRDRFRYPNQYKWKGRNDKVDALRSTSSLGFTINDYTRRMILNAFLTSIKRGEVFTSDPAFTEQMSAIQWENEWRFDAVAGFDEIFYAGALGWIAKDQWHPTKCKTYTGSVDPTLYDESMRGISYQKSPFSIEQGFLTMSLQHHLDDLKKKELQHEQEKAILYQ